MTGEKVKEVAALYREHIRSWVKHVAQLENVTPQRADENKYASEMKPPEYFGHLFYVCDKLDEFVDAGRMDKAFRWLGWIQGVLYVESRYSVAELGTHNMPTPVVVTDIPGQT